MPYKKILKKCGFCNKIILRSPLSFYCSQYCYDQKRKNSEYRKCLNCNKVFKVQFSRIKAGWGKGKYCSLVCYRKYPKSLEFRQCQSESHKGEKHWNWQGGIMKGRKERNLFVYKEWRKFIFNRDSYTCQICGIFNHIGLNKTICLNANHIKKWKDYPELRYLTINGITLCEKCHDFIRGKEEEWKDYFNFNLLTRGFIKDNTEFEQEILNFIS